VIFLPNTSLEYVHIAAQRIQVGLCDQSVEGASGSIPVKCSIGACGIAACDFEAEVIPRPVPNSYFNEMAKVLIQGADQMLYQAKQNGRACSMIGNSLKWIGFT